MASPLAQQLKSIQQADQTLGGVSAPAGKKASFLFDPKEAADFDAESIYELGLAGLQELQQLDSIFLRYESTLFSSTAIGMDRALLNAQENKDIDEQIKGFLRILSPYFLHKPAHKVLEWLIRKYRINDMNVEAVIECILPYHETPAFVRMVQILYFKENDKWGFLFDVKKNAKEINRSYLALRCLADRSILNFVAQSALWNAENASKMKKKNIHIVPFLTYLMLEYIHKIGKVELAHVTHILPVVESLITSKYADLQMSGYMILDTLCEKFQFSEKALNELLLGAAKAVTDTSLNELILLIADLMIRGYITKIPQEVILLISKANTAVAAIKKAAGPYNLKPLWKQFEAVLASVNEPEFTPVKSLVSSLIAG